MDWKEYTYKRKTKFCNLDLTLNVDFENDFGMPKLKPYNGKIPDKFISFNEALRTKNYGQGVHFFIDDYQFERIWTSPERYISVLSKFECVIAPDFSVFSDVPAPVNIWNLYRNKLIARFLQNNGINVIPNVSVCYGSLLPATIAGIEKGSVLAISNVRISSSQFLTEWFNFVREVVDKINPCLLLIYGNRLTLSSLSNVIYIENEQINRLRQWNKKKN